MGFDGPNKGSVVYRKADLDDTENEDVWDDSALIKMYDEMINRTYDSLGAQCTSVTKKKKKFRKSSKIKWHVGDHCMAPYYNDQLWYPAVVKKLDLDDGKCDVLYDVYDELARVSIADLTKPVENDEEGTSEGNATQETFETEEKVLPTNHTQTPTKHFNYMQSSSTDHTSIPSLVPPPPIAFTNLPPPDDDEALASMLMSWYMTGYHTGYYQAIQDKKKKAGKKV
ncbi:Survival motor neuron protein (SMN) family protein [Brugia pahangi]